MANVINNNGKWAPIEGTANAGGFTPKTFNGKEIVIDFDGSATSGTLYSKVTPTPFSTETTFVWNTAATDCADTADMTISWQGTSDASIVDAASDTGWTTVAIATLTGSAACDARTAVLLSGVSGVVWQPYNRFKFVLATASPGDIDIKCQLLGLPSAADITHSLALS